MLIPPGDSADVGRLAERQMRNWELARSQRPAQAPPQAADVQDFVAISRTVGSGGTEVAERLGERLRWPVFDRQILQFMAGDDQLRRRVYESMDERGLSWFEETTRSFLDSSFVVNDYFRKLVETIYALAAQRPGVFLGRAAGLILPQDRGLRVRIVAPFELRLRRFAARHGLSEDAARREIDRIETDRREFVRYHFRADADDPTRHDFVVNLGAFTPDQAVALIVHVMQTRGLPPRTQ